ncbi:hypothetical protein ACGK9R_09420 [Halomonas sp. HNIBRBA4712]|uniref:hypothetical protein n=1 Tax=Halomonas sp. HNIBRBA4712 TaxID=3373087 RepID=UPI00374721B7
MNKNFVKYLSTTINSPWSMWLRLITAMLVSSLAFIISCRRIDRDSFLLPFWKRSYNTGFWDAFWGFGGNAQAIWIAPSAIVSVVAAFSVLFIAFRGLFYYPKDLNLVFLISLLSDFILFVALITTLVYGGGAIETFYYAGAFIAGVVFFGLKEISRVAILFFIALVSIRLLFVEEIFIYLYLSPLCGLLYFFLRAPFSSSGFKESLEKSGKDILSPLKNK